MISLYLQYSLSDGQYHGKRRFVMGLTMVKSFEQKKVLPPYFGVAGKTALVCGGSDKVVSYVRTPPREGVFFCP